MQFIDFFFKRPTARGQRANVPNGLAMRSAGFQDTSLSTCDKVF